MSFLHSASLEATKTELDLFTLPPTQVSIENGAWIHYKPLASLHDQTPIEFVVPGHGDDYVDLAQTMFYVKAQIVKTDGSNLTADDNVGPVNNWLHSLFCQVDVYLNQKIISPPANTYAYRSLYETLLSYGPAAKNSHLTSSLFYKDTANRMDSIDNNARFAKRKELSSLSKPVEMYGPLYCDIFNVDRYLTNGVELRVKLVRSKDAFSLMGSADNYKIKILDASLLVRKVKISPNILIAHAMALEKTTAKYPLTRVETKVLTIPSNVQSKTLDNIFLGAQPKRIVLGFVTNKTFNGDITLNPFNFKHNDVSYLSLHIDGEQIPSRPLQPNFGEGSYVNCYHTLFSGTGNHYQDDGNDISITEYPNGYCLYAFDLTPDLAANSGTHWNVVKLGNMRIEVNFTKALAEPINCIVYAEFDSLLQINKDKNILVDFSS